MKKATITFISAVIGLALAGTFIFSRGVALATATEMTATPDPEPEPVVQSNGFEVEVMVNGQPLEEYAARGRHYVEALEGEEYSIRVRNPLGASLVSAKIFERATRLNRMSPMITTWSPAIVPFRERTV